MKKIRVEDALGMTLCHDITEMRDGFKGAVFTRGHVIAEEDISKLLDIGKRHVYIWEENAGELHEEDCAVRLAKMCAFEGGQAGTPSEGKIIIKAKERGMFRVDRELLRQINEVDDVTITSLQDHYPVEEGARLASMRIVPLVTKEENIIRAEKICEGKELFHLYPYQKKKAAMIITGSELYHGRIKDKFEGICRKKLEQYPCEILGATICDDDLEMMVQAAEEYLKQGAEVLIFSGGMSVDPDDLTPTAIRRLSDEVVSYGVPSQPGNMTMVAYRGDAVLLGVPGASISRPVTVFDTLLPQAFTGLRFTKEELTALGDGGLCQLCPVCHFPNCTFGRY